MTPGGRWWLGVALLLSLGVNLGLLAAVVGDRWIGHGQGDEPTRPSQATRPDSQDSTELTPTGHTPTGLTPSGDDHAPGWQPGEEGLATPPPDGQLRPPAPPLARMADLLGLEGEKRQRFIALQREIFTRMAQSRVRRRALTRQLYAELAAPQPDRDRVEGLLAELSRLYSETERLTATGILESRAMLNEEEQRRYLEILRRMHRPGGPHGPGARRGAMGGDGPLRDRLHR